MKIIYHLEAKEEILLENDSLADFSVDIEDAEIVFQLDCGKIRSIKVIFNGLPLKYVNGDIIDPYYPEKRMIAYKIVSYIANRLLIQSGVDCFDPQEILNDNEQVLPETNEERLNWESKRKRISKSLKISYSIRGFANLSDYAAKYNYADVYSNFADGIRAKNLITKYVSLYKVIERFFDSTGEYFDRAVSNYVSQFDPYFTDSKVRDLRILRNRCMHPTHNQGHITSDNIELMKQLAAGIKDLDKLARLLVERHP